MSKRWRYVLFIEMLPCLWMAGAIPAGSKRSVPADREPSVKVQASEGEA
jgi:hypothetical protein